MDKDDAEIIGKRDGLTVRELIELLLTFDEKLYIEAEGCDCIRAVSDAKIYKDKILIETID